MSHQVDQNDESGSNFSNVYPNDRFNYENECFNYLLSSLNNLNEEGLLKQENEIKKNTQFSGNKLFINNRIEGLLDEYKITEESMECNDGDNERNEEIECSNNLRNHSGGDKQKAQQQPLQTTERIATNRQRYTKKDIQSYQLGTASPIKKQNKQQNQETRNLPKYFGRHIIKRVRRKLEDEQNSQIKSEISNKLDRLEMKQRQEGKQKIKKIEFNLKLLRDILDESYFREQAIEYLTSFDFLDDLLQSDKQQDIRPQIKYVNRMYEGCYDRKKLLRWKDS
ncbi:unnamed protein product (macronuclear) [Paramecium tetraurelia]|uniref:Uncharacterized protein n=1 Tax=Paramecium tetraurelia TaxID=5888 RepID=A0CB75_PARTE|nr:uncharacterized protein GSPATT00036825001 [Paramecium tetraurelia]CAK68042.1 unnamed protein product [Paramecium tetraurelia]|eukprot:XP_001435439.1 hypothetical protein (macronuclear) [Paramecium tetraurelia strain d4-2]